MDNKDKTSKLESAANNLAQSEIAKKYNISPSSMKKIIIAGGAVSVIAVAMIFSSGNSLSCSSSGAKETVIQIAADNNSLANNIRWSSKGAGLPKDETCEQNNECRLAQENFDKVKAEAVDIARKCIAIQAVDTNDNCPEISNDSQNFTSRTVDSWGTNYYPDGSFDAKDSSRRIFMMQNAGAIIDRWGGAEKTLNDAKQNLITINSERKDEAWRTALSNIEYTLENIILTDKNKETGAVSCKATMNAEVPDWGGASKDITYTVEKTSEGELYATVWGL